MSDSTHVKVTVADPTPLGLFGLGMVTIVASSAKLGITSGTLLIIPWAIFLGSFAQLMASYFDFKKGNVFGATAFGAFGFFWMTVALSWILMSFNPTSFDDGQLAFGFLGYTIFAIYMTIGAMESPKILFIIFIFVDILLLALTLGTFGVAKPTMTFIAGAAEFLVAMTSFYGSAAIVLNLHFGNQVLPIGKPFQIFKK